MIIKILNLNLLIYTLECFTTMKQKETFYINLRAKHRIIKVINCLSNRKYYNRKYCNHRKWNLEKIGGSSSGVSVYKPASKKMKGGATTKRKPNAWQDMIKKVMAEKSLNFKDSIKYIKQNNLY